MAAYTRSSRESSFDQLRPELMLALREAIQAHSLGNETEIIMCCETACVRKDLGAMAFLLGDEGDAVYHTAMLITPNYLMWARSGDHSKTVAAAARLKDIRVTVYEPRLIKDAGLDISGWLSTAKRRIHGYVGLGPEAAAQKFCEEVKKAMDKANPPKPKRGFLASLLGR